MPFPQADPVDHRFLIGMVEQRMEPFQPADRLHRYLRHLCGYCQLEHAGKRQRPVLKAVMYRNGELGLPLKQRAVL
ncbi:hypothetical protein D3C75_814170 [compost metagenome]